MRRNIIYYSILAASSLIFRLGTQSALAFVSVTVSPANQVVSAGSSAVFSADATATAGETITGYEWLMSTNGLDPFTEIPRATTATCILTNVQPGDAGYYFVRVTFDSGADIGAISVSEAVALTVVDDARILAQPQDLNRLVGASAWFSVSADGLPAPGYQWRFNGTNLVNSDRVSGANGPRLTLSALVMADAGNYDVVVTNAYSAVTSAVATLGVYHPVAISVPPQNTTVIVGSNALFTVIPSASEPVSYQWQRYGTNLVDDGRIIGTTSNVLTIAATATNDAGDYTVSVGNPATVITSAPAALLVLEPARITSALNATALQGSDFSFTITATGKTPITFSAAGLPGGLSLDPATGVISGLPLVSGTFPITIGAANPDGSDTQVLTLTIASLSPVITSALTATWTENQTNFSYTISANNAPSHFGASNLPLGLSIDTSTGVISGTPLYGGIFTIPIWANNAWGTGSTNLVLTINYAPLSNLAIANVTTKWSKPYLLDFSFSLRDGTEPVVRPPSELQVLGLEDGVPISTSDAPPILESLMGSGSKQLKTILALDYTYSMFVVPGAIDAMQAAAQLLINEEPPHALFGIIEFNADYLTPQFVTNSLSTPNNYFITDKAVLSQTIAGIQTNYVRGNYAGNRCWDAMRAALSQFGADNPDEQRYLVAMTDGNDDASLLNTNAVNTLIGLAQTNHVAIYCVGFGTNVNTDALAQLSSQTGGQYYLAATTPDLALQFQRIEKDISCQYVLRWATMQRAAVSAYPVPGFQPSFQLTCEGLTASWNTGIAFVPYTNVNLSVDPPTTNIYPTNAVQYPFNPPDWAGDVRVGSLRLLADADLGPQSIRLQATYVPRFVRQMRLQYRPNYPCTASLDSTGPNEILSGWSLTETTDTNGLRTLTLSSPDPTDLLTSIKYAAFGDLVSFNFTYPESVTAAQAFSVFSVDNSILTNVLPSGQSFVMQNAGDFITPYPPAPPHGTPIPWLMAYGFTTNFAAAELVATNGLPVWQAYVAGLNPTNANSRFTVSAAFTPGQVPQIIFNTVPTRTYRVEAATSLGNWEILLDHIPGTGGNIAFVDNRVLSGVGTVFYRVGVY